MENYRVSCKKNTANKNSTVRKTKQNRLILLSNRAFVARNYCYNYLKNFIDWRQTVRITESHLRQPIFSYSSCGVFAKHREKTQKFRGTGNYLQVFR